MYCVQGAVDCWLSIIEHMGWRRRVLTGFAPVERNSHASQSHTHGDAYRTVPAADIDVGAYRSLPEGNSQAQKTFNFRI